MVTERTPSRISPARPKIDELEVEYISLAAKMIFLRQGDNIYATHLRDTVLVDPKPMASIARRMGYRRPKENQQGLLNFQHLQPYRGSF